MPRPRQVTDEQILATTRQCVLELGPQVSLDVVAERLGVTAPALLKRFGNRQELMLESLRPPTDLPFRRALERGPDPSVAFEPQLETLFSTVFQFFTEMVPRISALRESGIPKSKMIDRGASPVNAIRALTRWLELAAEAGLVKADAPESAATAMLGSISTRVFTAHWMNQPYSSRSNREYLKDVTQLFSRALSASAPNRRRKQSRRAPASSESP